MSVKRFANQFRALIEDIKSKGTAAINCDNLIAYLNEVENSPEPEPAPYDLEKYRADLQNLVEANKYYHEARLEGFRSVITAGQGAIKSSFLLNGGAALALLAFIGHLAEVSPGKVSIFAYCILPFTYGVLAIAVTSGFTYLSQWFYESPDARAHKIGLTFNVICIVLALASYVFFSWGLLRTYAVLANYGLAINA